MTEREAGEARKDWQCPRLREKPCEVASIRGVDCCFKECPSVTAIFGRAPVVQRDAE